MNKDLTVFENEEFGKLTVIEKNGEPWFIGRDVVSVLGYKNGSRDINRHCKYVELLKSTDTVLLEIPPRGLQIINEIDAGYALALSIPNGAQQNLPKSNGRNCRAIRRVAI